MTQMTLKAAFTFILFPFQIHLENYKVIKKKIEGNGEKICSVCISVNGVLVRAVSLSSAPGWGVTASCTPWHLGSHHSSISEVLLAAGSPGSVGTVGLPKGVSPSLPGKAGSSSTLFSILSRERWFGARFCMMAVPIQNVPWEQLIIYTKKWQLVTYCPHAVFYSLYGASGMFSNVVYSPNKCFYLAPGSMFECCSSL